MDATPDSAVLRPLRKRLVDAWTAGGGDPAAATVPSRHPDAAAEAGMQQGHRVDHVFVRAGRPGQDLTVPAAEVLDPEIDGVHPSDHKVVVCDLAWADG